MNKRNLQRCAREIQSQCGVGYSKAYNWAEAHASEILDMIRDEDGHNWSMLKDAAASLWRREHPGE